LRYASKKAEDHTSARLSKILLNTFSHPLKKHEPPEGGSNLTQITQIKKLTCAELLSDDENSVSRN
jgi:hypothetical protein